MKTIQCSPAIILSLVLMAMAGDSALGQALTTITFRPTYHGSPVRFDDQHVHKANDSHVTFSMLKFYVSNLRMRSTDGSSATIRGHYLLDLTEEETSRFSVSMLSSPLNSIDFTIGVDSILNEQGPQEGVLDPRNGMYWTWATGYVFFKLEGTVESTKQTKRVYEIHIGGYKAPYRNMIDVRCALPNGEAEARSSSTIDVELAELLDIASTFDLIKRPSVTTAQQAVDVAPLIGKMFRVR